MAEISFNEQERITRQLEAIEGRFEELSIRITLPEVISDSALFTSLMREHSEMEELNTIAVNYRRLLEEIAAAKELLEDPRTPFSKCAQAQVAMKPACSARSFCVCMPTMPPHRAGSLN